MILTVNKHQWTINNTFWTTVIDKGTVNNNIYVNKTPLELASKKQTRYKEYKHVTKQETSLNNALCNTSDLPSFLVPRRATNTRVFSKGWKGSAVTKTFFKSTLVTKLQNSKRPQNYNLISRRSIYSYKLCVYVIHLKCTWHDIY